MPFLGNQPAEGYRSIDKQTITGTGATVYTLTHKVASANDVEVFVNNVRQEPGVAYTCSGNQITFTTAVESSDDCYIVFQGRAVTSNIIESQNIADGTITAAKLGANAVPNEITKSATEPSNPTNGDLWYDTSNLALYFYDGSEWQLVKGAFSAAGGTVSDGGGYRYHAFTSSGTFQITKGSADTEYLVVAGGGGGGGYGGGGGAGGVLQGTITGMSAGTYSIVVGSGGSGGNASNGVSGVDSTINSGGTTLVRAIGGGYGGHGGGIGGTGGSGGGNSYNHTTTPAAGTSGQGNRGGFGDSDTGGRVQYPSGGGGGKGAVGQNADNNGNAGDGGIGGDFTEWATATSTGDSGYYGGGGGGGYPINSPYGSGSIGIGGLGGGANGGAGPTNNAGQANTGGGGGGGANNGSTGEQYGGAGGSGIVIIRYPI
jgi:hypothetical protein